MQLLRPSFTARIKSLSSWRRTASAKVWAFRRRSERCSIDLTLPWLSLFDEPLESAIQSLRNFLFHSYRPLCRRRHNRVLPSLSTRRSTFSCSSDFGLAARQSWPLQAYCFSGSRPHGNACSASHFAIIGLFLLRK